MFVTLRLGLSLLLVRLLELSKASEKEEISLRQRKSLVRFVAEEDVVEIGHSLEVLWSLAQVHWDLVVPERSPQMGVLAHDHLHVSHDRQAIFFIDQPVGRSAKDYVGDELALLIDTMVLSDGHSNSKVVLGKVRPNIFVC